MKPKCRHTHILVQCISGESPYIDQQNRKTGRGNPYTQSALASSRGSSLRKSATPCTRLRAWSGRRSPGRACCPSRDVSGHRTRASRLRPTAGGFEPLAVRSAARPVPRLRIHRELRAARCACLLGTPGLRRQVAGRPVFRVCPLHTWQVILDQQVPAQSLDFRLILYTISFRGPGPGHPRFRAAAEPPPPGGCADGGEGGCIDRARRGSVEDHRRVPQGRPNARPAVLQQAARRAPEPLCGR